MTAYKYNSNFNPRKVDIEIKNLEPKGRAFYRVHDLSIDTWNSSQTSYHHNTIGGYHAAKQQRYQDLITKYLYSNDNKVLSMLNMKYLIAKDQNLHKNPQAMGNAWFVRNIQNVGSANEELDMIDQIDPAETAIINISDFTNLTNIQAGNGAGSIELIDYVPDRLVYKSNTSQDQIAVFSEIWYPDDWTGKIDGKEVPIYRANYVLRMLQVPAGSHEIEFSYKPNVKGMGIAFVSSLVLLLSLIIVSYLMITDKKTKLLK